MTYICFTPVQYHYLLHDLQHGIRVSHIHNIMYMYVYIYVHITTSYRVADTVGADGSVTSVYTYNSSRWCTGFSGSASLSMRNADANLKLNTTGLKYICYPTINYYIIWLL